MVLVVGLVGAGDLALRFAVGKGKRRNNGGGGQTFLVILPARRCGVEGV